MLHSSRAALSCSVMSRACGKSVPSPALPNSCLLYGPPPPSKSSLVFPKDGLVPRGRFMSLPGNFLIGTGSSPGSPQISCGLRQGEEYAPSPASRGSDRSRAKPGVKVCAPVSIRET
ncbi:Hypothetical predicted protein [Marmota monax]|uniref:Uncharacterized protein n=1 Tax=Marmota monax TaxID=9995 RepID=A0A5E4B5N7_MARMO|nr:hypothetical protein GHT09_013932 [Marmota monax]VTJ65008.1 Hypothetical predicted protein [Marmota monax]